MRYLLALVLLATPAFAIEPAQQKAMDDYRKVQAAKEQAVVDCNKEKLAVKAKSPTTVLSEQAAAFAVCLVRKDQETK